MSKIKVGTITNVDDTSPVIFPTGVSGDGSRLTFEPKVVSFDPVPLATGISTTTNITVTFDQQVEFSGVGTIYIRESTPSGTISTYFTCGISTEATIAGETLIINPTNPIEFNKTYYVTLPSVGIANTFGAYYKGTVNYQFQTTIQSFTAQGGDHEFTVASAPSPTGYYKYHVFTSTGILTTTDSTANADSLSAMIVAGGGGGGQGYANFSGGGGGGAGGLIKHTGPTFALSAGTYIVTIGAGGAGGHSSAPTGSLDSFNGEDTTISSSPTTVLLTTYGGGGGGVYSPSPRQQGKTGGSGGGSVAGASPSLPGGAAIPGQGNPGGAGGASSGNSGGGGGAGGAGGTGSPYPTGTAVPTASPSGPYLAVGGNGGIGSANSEFTSNLLSGYVPTIPPATLVEIGPTGRYAGGGGGGVDAASPPSIGGEGGAGGGGNGARQYYLPSTQPTTVYAESGYQNTGGGGGSGIHAGTPGLFPISYQGASGGSGVFMIRYAVPAP